VVEEEERVRLRRPQEAPSPAEAALGDLRVRRAIRLAEASGDDERLERLARAYGVEPDDLVELYRERFEPVRRRSA
jgi:hypothetical protein